MLLFMANKQTKKQLQAEVALTLQKTFGEFKEQLSDKKFSRNIRKASKIIISGIKPAKPAKTKRSTKPVASRSKKAAPKAAAPQAKETVETTE